MHAYMHVLAWACISAHLQARALELPIGWSLRGPCISLRVAVLFYFAYEALEDICPKMLIRDLDFDLGDGWIST